MKKIVITTLLVATTALASAQVIISGKIGQYMDRTTTGSTSVTGLVAEPTSNITLRATEQLGNGLSARVVIDTRVLANDPTTAGTQIGDRQSTVGLANSLGSIDLGRNYHSVFNTIASNDVFGVFYGSIARDIHSVRDTRFSNGMFVTLTPIANGKVTYERANGNLTGDATAYSFGGSLGAVSATVARFESGVERTTVVGAGTKFGTTQVNVLHSDNTGLTNFKGNSVGVVQPLTGTAFSLKGSVGTKTGDIKAYNMGIDYAFSKNTVASVIYRNVNAPGSAADIKETGIGLLMKF
jgi:predicted porin